MVGRFQEFNGESDNYAVVVSFIVETFSGAARVRANIYRKNICFIQVRRVTMSILYICV